MSKYHLLTNEGILAVKLARQTIEAMLNDEKPERIPNLPLNFQEDRGVFVTLTLDNQLRGCIGYPYPIMSFEKAVMKAAISAAFEDPRFFPIEKKDFGKVCVEVTALTIPEELEQPFTSYINQIQIGKHGLMAEYQDNIGLLLPQVATEQGWDAIEFLCQTCLKAGLTPMAWKYGAKVYRLEGQIFHEVEPNGEIVEEKL
ncbi:hypothetical protein MsAg5_15340 [Methanosarcinaceae archaeon Ag5]|uniref:Protein MsAg5_15340 n=1 Tax=Methanolapillus africanus TaxID=3028297 RepID=A0AAE4SFS2_9EURY|nr:hypothetical protein [Methanosarcinaceae archaeon Ag5]